MQTTINYSKHIFTIFKNCEKRKGTIILDLRDDLHHKAITGMFGGEEYLEKKFPISYQFIQHARSVNTNSTKETLEHKQGFENYTTVSDIAYDKNKHSLYACGYTNLTGKAKALYQTIFIYRNGEKLTMNSSFDFGISSSFIQKTAQNIVSPGNDDEFVIIVHSSWQPNDGSNFMSFLSYDVRDKKNAMMDESVSKIEVQDPRNINTVENSNINVSYGRSARHGEQLDYIYKETRLDKEQKVYLPSRGKVTLLDGWKFYKGCANNSALVLNNSEFGTIWYASGIKDSHIKGNDKIFSWDIPEDWENKIPSSVATGDRAYSYDLSLSFMATKNTSSPKEFKINVTSYLKEANPHYKKIPMINLLWGCLAVGTKIYLANGNRKNIEDIHIGDQIMSTSHPIKVKDIYTGEEQTIFVLVTSSGKELLATRTHPIMTEKGMKPVIELSIGDLLHMEDGNIETLVQGYPIEYNNKVYNLDVEADMPFYANGFVVGGYTAQNSYNFVEKTIDVSEDLIHEVEKLRQMYK